jgi:oligosaccharide repeat unit polymerase
MNEIIFLFTVFLLFLFCFRIKIRGRISGIDIFLFLYAYFFIGPIIGSYFFGSFMYYGINLQYINTALLVYLVSNFALILGIIFFDKYKFIKIKYNKIKYKNIFIVQYILLAGSLALLLAPILFGGGLGFLSNVSKLEKLSTLGILHYVALTLVPCALISYMALFKYDRKNKYFLLCYLFYAVYCILVSERDFILFLIPMYFWYKNSIFVTLNGKTFFYFIFLGIIFTAISVGRTAIGGKTDIASFLNQGSNLMALTNTITYLESGNSYLYGLSYLSGIINGLSLGIFRILESRSSWLSNFFSNGVSGYGFSLEAEAYFNFGFLGVFIIFFLISLYYLFIENRAKSGTQFGKLLFYHFLFFFIYGIRGEFLMVFKSIIYTTIIFLISKFILTMRNPTNFRLH